MADQVANTINVPITKGKAVLEVNIDNLPDEVYREVMLQGLKTILNRGMSKITVGDLGDEEKVKTEATLKAQKNLEDAYAGKVRITGGKSGSKVSGAVKTEAMRLARNVIKDAIKRAGGKISHYEASEITKTAKAYLEGPDGKDLLAMAEANIKARTEKVKDEADKLSTVLEGIKESPELVAKAEAKKAKGKGKTLSAKQAGMTLKAKPKPTAQANA